MCHLGHAEESERAGLQARKGQMQRQDDVGEGKGATLMNIIMEGVSFYIYHRHFTERSGLDKFADMRVA